ncbi:MAG: hypothetical protein O3A10_00740 [Chloroflexi bacterium]|nr:hypothetical protein [Chloroflexota bacterium]MDA1146308.1 hypothetical protein [Chloroflexota bacterium]
MKQWQKFVALPAVGITILFSAVAPAVASADTDLATDRPADRQTDRVRDGVTDRVTDRVIDGRVELRESHTLEARGTGNVALAGRISMSGIAHGYSVTIVDNAGDAEIRVSARAHRRNDDGTMIFRGLNGEFSISGSDVVIKFHRVGIHFDATGNGRVALDGEGWFKLDGGRPQRWAAL